MALPSNPMIFTLPPGLQVCLNRDLPLWPAFPSLALLPRGSAPWLKSSCGAFHRRECAVKQLEELPMTTAVSVVGLGLLEPKLCDLETYTYSSHYIQMLLLSRFSRVRLCATPYTAAH